MIKTILWDFDGVILDSMKIKGNGFIELFKDFNVNDIKILEQYHYNNGGVSRFEKIRYFYNAILKKQVSENKINSLAGKFSKIIQSKIFNKSNLIQDSLLFIKKNYKKYNFHIISGAEHVELNKLCKYFEIDQYFISINGSPIKKEILVRKIIKNYKYKKMKLYSLAMQWPIILLQKSIK